MKKVKRGYPVHVSGRGVAADVILFLRINWENRRGEKREGGNRRREGGREKETKKRKTTARAYAGEAAVGSGRNTQQRRQLALQVLLAPNREWKRKSIPHPLSANIHKDIQRRTHTQG